MQTTTIPAINARKRLGELLEKVFYQSQQFRITRKDKPMARLVGEPFMQAINELLENDPALVDTLAITLNPEIKNALIQGEKDYKAGNVTPLKDILKEYDE